MMRPFLLLILAAASFSLSAQNENPYDSDLLPASFHQERREKIRAGLPENSIAVIFAAPERTRSNDVNYLYYLTGYNEPNAVLIITKKPITVNKITASEFMFVQERNPQAEVWTGRRLGTAGTKEKLGINAFKNTELNSADLGFETYDKICINGYPSGLEEQKGMEVKLGSLVTTIREQTKNYSSKTDLEKLPALLMQLRQIKLEPELVLLQKAIDATCEAISELARSVEPGMTEYQAQAIVEYFFKKNGSEYPGYPCILGAGENSCILHYESNRKKIYSNELLLADVGAEYHGYTADVTRTLPVDGEFSPEEKTIYELVLQAQVAGIEASRKGNLFSAPDKASRKVIVDGLIKLGIVKDEASARKYFPHGTSHYLGLDVHDAGDYGPLQTGQVITVEPGIYIAEGSPCDPKWWKIGVRIEDDVLITEEGNRVLSACVPKTVEEIEKLMKETGKIR
jgi:Xaa-Pro aminopeptidase